MVGVDFAKKGPQTPETKQVWSHKELALDYLSLSTAHSTQV
jgi:hypothetical protein